MKPKNVIYHIEDFKILSVFRPVSYAVIIYVLYLPVFPFMYSVI